MFSSLTPPKKAQLRAPLSPLQTAWTGFDPNLYSGGSPSAGPALVEIATAPRPQGTDLADNSLGGVECTANHPGSRGVADIVNVSVTMPLFSIKDPAVSTSTRAGPAEDDPLYKLGSKPVQAVCKGESGALRAFLGGVREENIWHQCPSHWQTPFFNLAYCWIPDLESQEW